MHCHYGNLKFIRPFPRQAKYRPVAGVSVKGNASVDLSRWLNGSTPLTETPTTGTFGGLSERMVGCDYDSSNFYCYA